MGAATVRPTTSQAVATILLVDDQSFVGMAVTRLLASESDLKIDCCLDAEAALARANALAPDLILQDLIMPRLDGLTLVRMYRDNPATARTPIIVLSGNDDDETRTRALASGANDYLVKLPPKANLVSCLRRHLAGHTAATPAPRPPIAGPAHDDTLDLRAIAEFQYAGAADMPGFGSALLDQFVQEITTQAGALREAAKHGDDAALRAIAHRLKGSAATVGARSLATLCGRLEEDLNRSDRGESLRALVAVVAEEVGRVREACARERERIGSSL